jgi:hypothetical protein
MQIYAEYLATMTVKTLNTIAKQAGLKGYSKLRKAELIKVIDSASVANYDEALATLAQNFTSRYTDEEVNRVKAVTFSDAPVTTEIKYGELWNCCKAQPARVVVFDNGARHAVCAACASRYTGEVQELPTQTPVAPAQNLAETTTKQDAQESDLSEVLYAYRAMRATFRTARGATQVKLATRLRTLGAQLKAAGYNMRTV